MPKEHCHWHLARRIADRLEPGPLADAVVAFDEFFLAGAVSHDSASYVRDDAAAKQAAERLHGAEGHDSFAPFRALAARRDELGAQGFAFGLGALSHLAADATLHPLVFCWTGDAGAPTPELRLRWMARHQACETALDLHCDALWGPPPVRTFATLIRQGKKELVKIHATFSGADSLAWMGAHGRLQRLFSHPVAALLARTTDHAAAFYRGGPALHPAFEGTLEWIDPVTGSPNRATLDQLIERYEAMALGLAAAWESAWAAGAVPFSGRIGWALDTGVPCDRNQEKRFFRARWF